MIKKFTTDDRGVSEVIGAILVFGLLIALLAIMQTTAIPAANEQVEFNHNQGVQSDLVRFHEATSRVASEGSTESTGIQMGATYPNRLLFFSPSDPSGEIRAVGEQNASIQNIEAVDGNVNDYIDGSMTDLRTKRLEYSPNYNEFGNAPTTVLEYGYVYRDFGDQVAVDNPGRVVNGNTISLTFFNGDMSRTQGSSLSLEAQATSAPARTVTVTNSSDGPIQLELPSNLNASQWNQTLGEEESVKDIRPAGDGKVEIDLNGSRSYNLEMAQIGVGSGVPTPEAHYVTRASNQLLQIGQANQLPIEVRDRYNNPVSGASLNITVEEGEFQNGEKSIETTTTDDGQPAAQYFGSDAGVDVVRASLIRDPSTGFDDGLKGEGMFNVSFNPRLDNEDPVLDSTNVNPEIYRVCSSFTGFGEIDSGDGGLFPDLGDIIDGLGDLGLLGCATTSQVSQLQLDYEVSDSGGAGLDYLEISIDDGGSTDITTTQNLRGANAEGELITPRINESISGQEVEISVYDRNGNEDSDTKTVN